VVQELMGVSALAIENQCLESVECSCQHVDTTADFVCVCVCDREREREQVLERKGAYVRVKFIEKLYVLGKVENVH